jgi:hypothetical protein
MFAIADATRLENHSKHSPLFLASKGITYGIYFSCACVRFQDIITTRTWSSESMGLQGQPNQ